MGACKDNLHIDALYDAHPSRALVQEDANFRSNLFKIQIINVHYIFKYQIVRIKNYLREIIRCRICR